MTADDALKLGEVWRFNRKTFRAERLKVTAICADDSYLAVRTDTGIEDRMHPHCVYATRGIAVTQARMDASSTWHWAKERFETADAYLRDNPDGEPVGGFAIEELIGIPETVSNP